MRLLWLVLAASAIIEATCASKILFLLPLASKSHKNVFDPLINALLENGHELTVVSPVKTSKPVANLREIIPVSVDEISNSPAMSGGNMFENRKKGKLAVLLGFNSSFSDEVCHRFYQNEDIIQIIRTNEHFDLAFVNGVLNQCTLGLVHHLQVSHAYLSTLPLPNTHISITGAWFPTSYIPSAFSPYSDKMTFFQRVMNFIIDIVSGHLYYQRSSVDIYRQYLGSHVPTVDEIDKKASMIFMNTFFLLTFARPLPPDIIEIGGMHCKEASSAQSTIPPDLADILNNAKHGFVYFSLGSIIRTQNMPKDVRNKFLNVFSRLKQIVIWKWDNENETDLPSNVVVRKWLPQQDVLAHENIKLFITHGGLLSTQESLYFGVPCLGFPFYVDQDLNMNQAENLGLGMTLEITDFTEELLETKINAIISEPRYLQRAKNLSKIFRDQPQTPLERAVFWTEYLIRHKGAPHLISQSRELTAFQYYSLDVILLLTVLVLGSFSAVAVITLKLIRNCQQAREIFKQKIS